MNGQRSGKLLHPLGAPLRVGSVGAVAQASIDHQPAVRQPPGHEPFLFQGRGGRFLSHLEAVGPDMDNWRAWLEDYTLADVAGLDNAEGLIDDLRDLGEDGSDGELGMDSTLAEILDYDVIQTRRQTLQD